MGLEVFYLLLVIIQPEFHILWQIVHVVQRMVTVGQNLLSPVITCDNSKTAIGVHHIINSLIGTARVYFLMHPLDRGNGSIESVFARMARQETLGTGASHRHADIGSHHLNRHTQEGEKNQ